MKIPTTLALPLALFASVVAWFRPAPEILDPEAREFLRHVSMVDLPIDYQGHKARAVRIEGLNVQIVNGTGVTNSTNALGNLIIGYNEPDGTAYYDRRTGSHNIVGGEGNGYTDSAGLVMGWGNILRGGYSCILYGLRNEVPPGAPNSVIIGGAWNTTGGSMAVVTGGQTNNAAGERSWVGGGEGNTASGVGSSVVGADGGSATGRAAVVSGGRLNTASGDSSAVSGGFHRTASGTDDWVAGGLWQDQ